MQKYGIRIGDVGVEFPSVEDRQKALIAFTKGTDVKINEKGIRFANGNGSFSVYDRDTKEVLTVCEICKGVFLSETCTDREYPQKNSWEKEYSTGNGFICEACFAKRIKDKELCEAKKLVESQVD